MSTQESDANLSALNAHYLAMTQGISERVRYIAFGILALIYALYSSDTAFAEQIVNARSICLNFSALAAALAIGGDFGRQLCSFLASARAYENAKFDWNKSSLSYRLADILFWFKQITVAAAVVALFSAFVGIQPAASVKSPKTSAVELSAVEQVLERQIVLQQESSRRLEERLDAAEKHLAEHTDDPKHDRKNLEEARSTQKSD